MTTIIAGSRSIKEYTLVKYAIESAPWIPTEVISGRARGVDRLGERWAKENNVQLFLMPADWDKHGKRAGYLRNRRMAADADALIAIWDGESRGTRNMIEIAEEEGLEVYVVMLKEKILRPDDS